MSLDGAGTEQGASQLSLDVFCRAFQILDDWPRPIHRGPKSTDLEMGGRKLTE